MQLYSPAGYFMVMTALLALAASPLLRGADASGHAQSVRVATIDGLRGFLALGVFFHHAMIYHLYLQRGLWTLPPSAFFTQLGQSAVLAFFMITGYLFWGKALAASGRLDWLPLYIGRVLRIGPVYYLATAGMLAIVCVHTALHPAQARGSLAALVHELSRLALLGYFTPGARILGYAQPWILLAGVTWTLHFEWLFYLLILPCSSVFARWRWTQLPYVAAGLAVLLARVAYHPTTQNVGFAAFYAGMLCATLRARGLAIAAGSLSDRLASAAVLALLVVLVRIPQAYALRPLLLLCVMFALLSSGCSLFGLLRTRASRRLGEISYCIYLLQGLALHAWLSPPWLRNLALSSVPAYWGLVLLTSVTLILAALFAHVLVEKPGIALGRKIAGRHARTPA